MITKRNKFNPEREGQLFSNYTRFQKIVFWKLAFYFHGYFAIDTFSDNSWIYKWITLDNILDNFG